MRQMGELRCVGFVVGWGVSLGTGRLMAGIGRMILLAPSRMRPSLMFLSPLTFLSCCDSLDVTVSLMISSMHC